ncbi:MAG TPA: hypothetical protein VIY48_17600 [Candidatus Paceibacterota bacterium]
MEWMRLRKETGKSGVAGYWWENDGDVVSVPWALGESILTIKGADFTQVLTEEDEPPDDDEVDRMVPHSSMDQVMAWVGTDKRRAEAALRVERLKKLEARASLISRLEKVIG